MRPFRSAEDLLDAHEAMFGDAGHIVATYLLKWAPTLFAVPLDPLSIRVVIAPGELGPYNRHLGYAYSGDAESLILLNRNLAYFSRGMIILDGDGGQIIEDFIVHELTHIRQVQLLAENHGRRGWAQNRGAHRDRGWFSAITEASVSYLGVRIPESSWPARASVREGARVTKVARHDVLTEPEMTDWPASIRMLAERGDPRLAPVDATQAA